jgi:hypothetical protein
MQTPESKNHALLLATEEELFTTIVTEDHPFRKLTTIIRPV